MKILELEDVHKGGPYPGADHLGSCGFFIGVHTYPLSESQITYLANSLLDFDFKKECVMVTGGTGIVGSALKEYVEKTGANRTRKWIFLSSRDGDLRNLDETEELFRHHKQETLLPDVQTSNLHLQALPLL